MIAKPKMEALLACVAGIGLALSMPGFPFGPVVFVALVPLFFGLGGRRSFWRGYLAGAVFFGLDLRWGLTLTRFSPLAVPGMILLVAYLALYFGLFSWGTEFVRRRLGESWAFLAFGPLLFTGLEILRAHGPLGSCFSDLYLGLYRFPSLIQGASIVGPWGITAAIVFVNGAVYLGMKRRKAVYLAAAAGMIGLMAAGLLLPTPTGTPIKAAVVASTVPQEEKRDDRNLLPLLEKYVSLGQRAAAGHPGLIVYPESILPGYILQDEALLERFSSLAKQGGCSVLLGTGDLRAGRIYNSVALISPDGEVSGVYDMVHPVPFGEYIPGRRFLERIGLGRLAASFLPVDLTPGEGFIPLGKIGTPICFESTFPAPARGFVRNGADLLVTVTNDAWFSGSSELLDHFAFAVFRAVENRRWVIQAANGGISGAIDPRGRIVEHTRDELVFAVNAERESGRSPYTVAGERPFYACFGLVLFVSGLLRVHKWKRGR